MGLIPTEKTSPTSRFGDLLTLIYGAPKVGKSTFCSELDKPLFLDTENGLQSLSVYRIGIDSWETFISVYKELKAQKGKLPFNTLVIDTIDNLWQMCSDFICKKNGLMHESDLDYGKGYSIVKKEFNLALAAYRGLGMGVIYTSHADSKEIKTKVGSYSRFEPTMPKTCASVVLPTLDFILYAESREDSEGNEVRILHTKPSRYWNAGDKTGKLPEEIEMRAGVFLAEFDKVKGAKVAENKKTEGKK